MKKYYIFYEYDYAEMGGVGWIAFDTAEEAEGFILDHLRDERIQDFTVVYGEVQEIKIVEKVKRVCIE